MGRRTVQLSVFHTIECLLIVSAVAGPEGHSGRAGSRRQRARLTLPLPRRDRCVALSVVLKPITSGAADLPAKCVIEVGVRYNERRTCRAKPAPQGGLTN
jgi:hypothetical protein